MVAGLSLSQSIPVIIVAANIPIFTKAAELSVFCIFFVVSRLLDSLSYWTSQVLLRGRLSLAPRV
ncbi:hypothetical protein BJX65DRAFT_276989 [Aspergillus insuetus]